MAIIATPGSATANSYGTMVEADAYFVNHPNQEDWDEATNAEEALIYATQQLELLDYVGERATDTQSLEWPRISDDIFELTWTSIEIPPGLKKAQFKWALKRILEGSSSGASVITDPVSSLKIGDEATVTYDTSGTTTTVDTTVGVMGLPLEVEKELKGLRVVALFA